MEEREAWSGGCGSGDLMEASGVSGIIKGTIGRLADGLGV